MEKPSVIKQPYKSFAGKGIDVASKRADDLDKLCLVRLQEAVEARVLDIGCGAGGQSLRMALAGAFVTAVDEYDFSDEFSKMRTENKLDATHLLFVPTDIESFLKTVDISAFDISVFQRTLHYFPYDSAKQILRKLRTITRDTLYVSVTGMHSAVGRGYCGHNMSVTERFSVLAESEADTFSIHQPVCLYTEAEFCSLLKATGWNVEKIWTSAFGNIKAVCR